MQNVKNQLLKIKTYVPFVIAPLVSFGLFVIMGFLIFEAADLQRKKTKDTIKIDFLRSYKETSSKPPEPIKPSKPNTNVEQQPMPATAVSQPQQMAQSAMNAGAAPPTGRTFDASAAPGAGAGGVVVGGFAVKGSAQNAAEGSGIGFGGGGVAGGGGSGSLTPLVRNDCDAPNKAKSEGIKGFIVIRYDVNEGGQTENVQVADASPTNVFEQNCVRAVQQWRFKPPMADGKPIAVRGNQFRFNFGDYSGSN